jgi:hypothetical protein
MVCVCGAVCVMDGDGHGHGGRTTNDERPPTSERSTKYTKNCTESRPTKVKLVRFETPKPHPLHGKPPIEVPVPDTSRGGRAGRAPLTPRRAPGAPKCARRPCNDTQEIAKSFWSYSYGGLS